MLSPSKIALTVVILIVVFFGYRLISSIRNKTRDPGNRPLDTVDLVQCSACKKYVDPDQGKCLRGDCPYA